MLVAEPLFDQGSELESFWFGDEGKASAADGSEQAGRRGEVAANSEPGGDGVQHVPHPGVAAQEPIPGGRAQQQQAVDRRAGADVGGTEHVGGMVENYVAVAALSCLPERLEGFPP